MFFWKGKIISKIEQENKDKVVKGQAHFTVKVKASSKQN